MTSIDERILPVQVPGTKAETLAWVPVDEIDQLSMTQLRNVASLPWVAGVRSMPDVHGGFGVPIGSVVAMHQAVSPSACGVDLGCGVAAVRTSLTNEQLPDNLREIRMAVESVVPVGHLGNTDREGNPRQAPIVNRDEALKREFASMFGTARSKGRFQNLTMDFSDREIRAVSQCGSLGGGNHFWELNTGADGYVWVTLHSGSRNIGKEIAERHIAKAMELDHNQQLADPELAVFLAGTKLMDDYVSDMRFAQDYAMLNRRIMMATAMQVLRDMVPGISFDQVINCHHNYISFETYQGVELTITRKGAIFAGKDALAVIPGSMGTGSYIVRGLGNELSYNSASHGAGRKMSRNQAKKTFTLDDLAAQTAGIECRKDAGVLDEAPGAYKDIDQVIKDESDLVEVVTRLNTVLCIKG